MRKRIFPKINDSVYSVPSTRCSACYCDYLWPIQSGKLPGKTFMKSSLTLKSHEPRNKLSATSELARRETSASEIVMIDGIRDLINFREAPIVGAPMLCLMIFD